MSRIAQEMQRIADELAKARQPKKGRRSTVNDDDRLQDVTAGEPAAATQDAPAAAAAEEQPMAAAKRPRKAKKAKSASAKRSAAWRAKQKREAASAPAETDKANIKAQGDGAVKTVFVTTTVALARRAFRGLLDEMQAAPDAPQNVGQIEGILRVVNRLGA